MEAVKELKQAKKEQSAQQSPLQGAEGAVSVSGSVAVLEAFIAEGVDTIFGYPGGAIMPIYDALYDYTEKLKHILVDMSKVQFMQHKGLQE